MAGIKSGDNGTVIELPVRDGGEVVSLVNATVSVVIKNGERRFIKEAQITDAAGGLCEITLTSVDVANTGSYNLQGIVRHANGNEFASDIEKFTVGGRL